MKKQNKSVDVFFAILKGGLWEQSVHLLPYGDIDFSEVQTLAEEQSVVGLVAAGLEHVNDMKLAKKDVVQFIGQTLQLEERNTAMNSFIEVLVNKMRNVGIYTLLVKGQGIAQCYERPLWRSCGDIDFFLSEVYYNQAKQFLIPFASSVEQEGAYGKHLGMTIDPWVVELHGSLRCGLSPKMDKVIDSIQEDTFCKGNVRSWRDGETDVFLPSVDNDVVLTFTHFLKHFYKGGIGLRQICDWCRLLWTFRSTINGPLLESRLKSMGLVSEWHAFAAYAVEYLGMPNDAMPLYSTKVKWRRKASRIQSFLLEVGNFGHKRDSLCSNSPYVIRKTYSFIRRMGDLCRHSLIFPLDSFRFFPSIVVNGLRSAARGE